MTLPRRAVLATLVAILLAASAAAHATLGWPPFRAELLERGMPAEAVGALAAGWYFGSIAMGLFAGIAWHVAKLLRQGQAAFVSLRIIGAGYLVFGLGACLLRNYDPHFLGFAGIGVLALAAGWPAPGEG